jgi:hypothetical protein
VNRKSVFGRDLDPEHDVLVYQTALTLPLSHALDKRLFLLSIPDYQREYLWDKENLTKLLEDLLRSMEHRDRTYCLGSPVLMCFLKDSGFANYIGKSIPDDAPFPSLRAELLDGQQRFATLVELYAVISAMILDIDSAHEGALALQSRFVHCQGRGVACPQEGENLLALQAVRAAANQTTQQDQLAQYVLPLFGPQGPARLRSLLTLVEQGVICANVVAIYQWLAAYAGCALSGLPAGAVQQQPRVLPASHPLAAFSPLRKLEALLAHLEKRVTVAPVLLNADEVGKQKYRLFASFNCDSARRVLSDTATFNAAVHYLANPEGRKSANVAALADWFQWTHAVGEAAFLRLLNTMRWTEQAEAQNGDVSGKMLNVSQLLEYFLAEPVDGRAGYTWRNHDSSSKQPRRCWASKEPIAFVAHLKQWKRAADALADLCATHASASNILGVLACAGDDVAPVCDMLALALQFWVRATPAAFTVLLGRVELLAVTLCLATPPGDQNHLRAPRRRRRLADVACVLRKMDPTEVKSDSPALLHALALSDGCPDGASEKSAARALLTDALYTHGSNSGRARFMLAAAEASVHRRTTAQPSPTEMANGLDAARSAGLSQIEHILAQKFATDAARDAWRANGWTDSLGGRAVNLLGNLELLPKQGANDEWLNQLLGGKHYDSKRTLCIELGIDQNFRLLALLMREHDHWTPADFMARHLGLVGSLAQRWGPRFEAAVASELRAVMAAEAGQHEQLFSAEILRVAARILAESSYKCDADILRAALEAVSPPPPPPRRLATAPVQPPQPAAAPLQPWPAPPQQQQPRQAPPQLQPPRLTAPQPPRLAVPQPPRPQPASPQPPRLTAPQPPRPAPPQPQPPRLAAPPPPRPAPPPPQPPRLTAPQPPRPAPPQPLPQPASAPVQPRGGPFRPLAPSRKQNCAEFGCLAQKPADSKKWVIIGGDKFCCKCAGDRGVRHGLAPPPADDDDDFDMYDDEVVAHDAAPAAASEDAAMEQEEDEEDDAAAPVAEAAAPAAALWFSEPAMLLEEEEEEDAGAGAAADDDEVQSLILAAAAAKPPVSRVSPFTARPDTDVARSYKLLELHGALTLPQLTQKLRKDVKVMWGVNTLLRKFPEHFHRERDAETDLFVFSIRAPPGAAATAAVNEGVYEFAEPEAGAAGGGWLSRPLSPAHTPHVTRQRRTPPATTPAAEKRQRQNKKWSEKELSALCSLRREFDKWADIAAAGTERGVLQRWRNANSCEIAYRRRTCRRRL